jgi:hypothetical protein
VTPERVLIMLLMLVLLADATSRLLFTMWDRLDP